MRLFVNILSQYHGFFAKKNINNMVDDGVSKERDELYQLSSAVVMVMHLKAGKSSGIFM